MNKFFKRILMGSGLLACLLIFTSCTKSFCSINDQACLYDSYEAEHREDINNTAKTNGIVVPDKIYWDYIDSKVDGIYDEIFQAEDPIYTASQNYDYIPSSYVESHMSYLASENKEEATDLVNEKTIKAVIRYTGRDKDSNIAIWANIDKWNNEFAADTETAPNSPTSAYMNYYKTSIQNGVGMAVTCLTPESGYFGIDQSTFIEGKTWGQAFTEYGPLEGLLVYPIGWLIYQFTIFFGTDGAGQILSIFLVTLIVRAIIVLFSAGSLSTQYKMTELQPEIEKLQARYPNSGNNENERQALATAQMKLYKEYNIHPFRQFLVLIIQFPLFICVWGALQGSAILTQGSVFGLSLSSLTSNAILSGTSETPFAIVLFLMMSVAQFFATLLPIWLQNYRKSKIVGNKTVKVEAKPNESMMKYMPYIMLVVIIFMSLSLPAAMGIYWFFGALISIFQTVLTEIYHSCHRGQKPKKKDKFTSYKKVDKKKHMKIR